MLQVVQMSVLSALAGQVAGGHSHAHHRPGRRQELRHHLPLQVIAEQVGQFIPVQCGQESGDHHGVQILFFDQGQGI